MTSHAMALGVGIVGVLACGCDRHHDWRVSGHVRLADQTPVAGVHVRIEWPDLDSRRTVTTDARGFWRYDWDDDWWFSDWAQEHVHVTAVEPGFAFAPASYDLRLHRVDDDLDFVATPVDAPQLWLQGWVRWSDGDDGDVEVQIVEVTSDATAAGSRPPPPAAGRGEARRGDAAR